MLSFFSPSENKKHHIKNIILIENDERFSFESLKMIIFKGDDVASGTTSYSHFIIDVNFYRIFFYSY
jgi:hypothetical protein